MMSNNKKPFHPFAYDNEYYLYADKEKATKEKFESFLTQREASYKESAEEVYNNKHLEDKDLFWEAFRENIEAPTPQIKEVDGYKSQSEIGENKEVDGYKSESEISE